LLPPMVNTGRTLVIVVVLYGIGTIAFGVSTWFPLSLLIYALMAAADQVSVVIRQTIIQLETPDALRGRVSSVNSLFIGASNQLGAVESGLVATWTGSAVIAVVSGGLGCLISVAGVTKLLPQLWRHRTLLHAEAPAEPAAAVAARR
jgi:MFS family permease